MEIELFVGNAGVKINSQKGAKAMNDNELTARLLAEHYQKGREELAEEILKTIKAREHLQDIGTLTRIYSYCKKQVCDPKQRSKK